MQQSHIKPEIRNWTRLELRQWLEKQSEQDPMIQPYRADQIFYWLYRRQVHDFSEMANIGKPTRNVLEKHFRIGNLKRDQVQRSRDGSLKYRLMLKDDKAVETVLMPHADHHTVCISSQVGCGMGCDFCMTGKMGLIRNLEVSEIVNQVLEAWQDLLATMVTDLVAKLWPRQKDFNPGLLDDWEASQNLLSTMLTDFVAQLWLLQRFQTSNPGGLA